jgi:hypothetical protein
MSGNILGLSTFSKVFGVYVSKEGNLYLNYFPDSGFLTLLDLCSFLALQTLGRSELIGDKSPGGFICQKVDGVEIWRIGSDIFLSVQFNDISSFNHLFIIHLIIGCISTLHQ